MSGEDAWTDPYAAEVLDNERPQPSPRADFSSGGKRVQWQTYAYDWLGNTTTTDDDQHAFYDRSLGTVGNGTTKRYQLDGANNTGSTGTRNGSLSATYDAAGNLLTMDVGRDGKCVPAAKCLGDRLDQHFEYQWDEVGRLTRAQRWDENPPDGTADADLSFTYDASDQRVRKTSGSSHTLYVFGSLELRRAAYDGNDYVLSETTEVPYLFANGVRLGRVVHDVPPDDYVGQSSTRVFLELGDHLGSTSVVLDLGSGELVQRSTAYAYGEVESTLRPGRWESFREDYRFTGKEDDIEVGLIYFGKRFLNPLLGRWISPDPLAIHAPGQADLNLYAYVHGKVLVAVDPVGLAEDYKQGVSFDSGSDESEASVEAPYTGEGTIYASDPRADDLDIPRRAEPNDAPSRTSVGQGGSGQSESPLEREHKAAYESGRLTTQGLAESDPIGVAFDFEAEVGHWTAASTPFPSSFDPYDVVDWALAGAWLHVEGGAMVTSAGELKVYVGHSSNHDVEAPNYIEPLVAGANADVGMGVHFVADPKNFGSGDGFQYDGDLTIADIVVQTNDKGEFTSLGAAVTWGPGWGVSKTNTRDYSLSIPLGAASSL